MNTPLTEAQVTIPVNVLVSQYRKLRDRKKEIVDRQKNELEPISTAMDKLEFVLLDYLNRAGVESARTDDGTAFKVTRTSYKIDDPGALRDYVEQFGLTDLYENRVSSSAIEELLSRGQPLPPGIAVSSFVTVNVRK